MYSYLPSRCILEMEYYCNLKCQSCTVWKENYRKLRKEDKDILDYKQICQLQKRLSAAGVKRITYIGGEPFLNAEIISIALNAKENHLIPSIVTNGTLLDKERIEFIVKNKSFNTIIFSLDGPENIHNLIRGNLKAYQAVFESLRLFQRFKNLFRAQYPRVYIYSTISRLNYKYIEDIYKIACSVNASKIRFQLASSVNEEIINKTNKILGFKAIEFHSYSTDLALNKEEIIKVSNVIFKLARFKKSNIKIETEQLMTSHFNKKCHFVYKDFIITPSGKILICPMLTEFSVGNIKEDNVEEVFFKNKIKIDLILTLAEKGELPICSQCCVEKILF